MDVRSKDERKQSRTCSAHIWKEREMPKPTKKIDGQWVRATQEDFSHLVYIDPEQVWDFLPPEVQERVSYSDFATICLTQHALSLEWHVLSKVEASRNRMKDRLKKWQGEKYEQEINDKFAGSPDKLHGQLDRLLLNDQVIDNEKAKELIEILREELVGTEED